MPLLLSRITRDLQSVQPEGSSLPYRKQNTPAHMVDESAVLDAYVLFVLERYPSNTDFGRMHQAHVENQLRKLAGKGGSSSGGRSYREWFEDFAHLGVCQGVIKAAIAASDLPKTSPEATTALVQELEENGSLLYGRAPANTSPLSNLYFHSEAARSLVLREFARFARKHGLDAETAVTLGEKIAEAIIGHDSFRSGFGKRRLQKLLQDYAPQILRGDRPFYPAACSLEGLLVQVMDRLDALEISTMMRYVMEGIENRKETITQAIQSGIKDNVDWLEEAYGDILFQAGKLRESGILSKEQYRAFLCFPGLLDLQEGLQRARIIADCFTLKDISGNHLYCVELNGTRQEIRSIESLEQCIPEIAKAA